MKTEDILKHNLMDMEVHELNKIIEDDYYRGMIACDATTIAVARFVLGLIDEILKIEEASAEIERYDLAIYCREKRVEIADQICVPQVV